MTAEERRSIEHECARLIALYANLNDQARWDDLAALYTEDGSMSRPTAPDVDIMGRAVILAGFKSRAPRVTRHVCANVVIEVESDSTASGTSAMVLYTANNTPIVGSFHDRFVLTEHGWRFARRRGSLTFS